MSRPAATGVGGDDAWVLDQQPQAEHGGHGLARARLANHGQDFAGLTVQRRPSTTGTALLVGGSERSDYRFLNGDGISSGGILIAGSSASRRPSPIRLIASGGEQNRQPGKGRVPTSVESMKSRADGHHRAPLGGGGCAPRPRKPRAEAHEDRAAEVQAQPAPAAAAWRCAARASERCQASGAGTGLGRR